MNRIRLLLVDNQFLFGECLVRFLSSEPEFEMVSSCRTIAEALEALIRSEIDVVLFESDFGSELGNRFLSSARQSGYRGQLLLLTSGMSVKETSMALKLGASGILLKTSPSAALARAIRIVAGGGTWIDPKVMEQIVHQVLHVSEEKLYPSFTDRESQVLKGVFEGLTNMEIGKKIGRSEDSIKKTLRSLLLKTGARKRSQLVRIALEHPFEERNAY